MRACLILLMFGITSLVYSADFVQSHPDDSTEIITGAKISTAQEAKVLVRKECFGKLIDPIATEFPLKAELITLGFSLGEFFSQGQQIWVVTVADVGGIHGFPQRGVIWINPQTSKMLVVVNPWNSTVPSQMLNKEDVKNETDIKRIAFEYYKKKMDNKVLSSESISDAKQIITGFTINDFAERGNAIWQVKITTVEKQLRGVIWINPSTNKILFVVGAWTKELDSVAPNKRN